MDHDRIAILIQCKGNGIAQVPELIPTIERLKESYVVKFRLDGRPQANGVVDGIVEIIVNLTLNDVLIWIGGNLLWDQIKKEGKALIVEPLRREFQALETNECWVYSSITLSFEDTTIKIWGTSSMFTLKLQRIMHLMSEHYQYLKHPKFGLPETIVIPVCYESSNETYQVKYHDQVESNYQEFWGVSYYLNYERRVYDLRNKILTDKVWADKWTNYEV